MSEKNAKKSKKNKLKLQNTTPAITNISLCIVQNHMHREYGMYVRQRVLFFNFFFEKKVSKARKKSVRDTKKLYPHTQTNKDTHTTHRFTTQTKNIQKKTEQTKKK